jgi:hypothetical protein
VSNTWVSYLLVGNNFGKPELIPDVYIFTQVVLYKDGDPSGPIAKRCTRGPLACW